MSFEVPAGGSGSVGFTNTGLGYDGTNLLIGDFTNGRIVKTTTAGAYVSEIVLASAPASSVQGVAYDSSDGTYWVCHYAATNGTIKHYDGTGALLGTISPGVAVEGPNGCAYDSANDRILAIWNNGVIRGYDCADGSLDETITLSSLTGTTTDGIALDPSSPSTKIWVAADPSVAQGGGYLQEVVRSTGVCSNAVMTPASVDSIVFVGSALYVCCDQGFHNSVTNGNRVWQISQTTGRETVGSSLQVASGSITLAVADGRQIVTAVGFAPRVVIFFGGLSSSGVTELIGFGVTDDQARQWVQCTRNPDALATTVAERAWDSLYCLASTTGGGAYSGRAAFVSVTHDGFMLTVTTDGNAREFQYLAFAGDDFEAKVGSFDLTTAAGTQAVTGVGFTPKATLFSCNTITTDGVITTETRLGLGVMTAAAQWVMTHNGIGAQLTTDEQGIGRTDAALTRISNTLTTTMLASYSAFGSDGFTVSKGTAPGANVRIGYVALGGAAQFAAGAFNQPTSTGSQAITGVGFMPKAELFASAGRVASTTVTAHSRTMIGAAISSSNRRAYAVTAEDGAADSNTARDIDKTAAIIACTDGGTPTRLATAGFTSQDADGFTLNWTAADAVAREVYYLAVGDADAGLPTLSAPTYVPGSITSSGFTGRVTAA